MIRKKIKLPEGCNCIIVEAEKFKVSIKYITENKNEFFCEHTGEIEEVPEEGDLSIFWDNNIPQGAEIAYLKSWNSENGISTFRSTSGFIAQHAIRFRNESQFKKIVEYGKREK